MAQNVKAVCGVLIANVNTVAGIAIANVKTIAGVDNTGGGPSYLVNQNFETPGTGYDNGETWSAGSSTGTVDPDNATNPIVGTQSLNIITSAQTGSTFTSFTAQDTVYGFFRMRINSYGGSTQTIAGVRNTGASLRGTIQLTGTRQLRALTSGGTGNASTDVIPTGVGNEIYVWFEYVKATVAANDAIMRVGWSADGTKPTFTAGGAKTAISSNGTSQDQMTRVYMGQDASSTWDLTFDRVLISSSAIGNNP